MGLSELQFISEENEIMMENLLSLLFIPYLLESKYRFS
jgi:hypothetical protein